jgi:hypothetical protein
LANAVRVSVKLTNTATLRNRFDQGFFGGLPDPHAAASPFDLILPGSAEAGEVGFGVVPEFGDAFAGCAADWQHSDGSLRAFLPKILLPDPAAPAREECGIDAGQRGKVPVPFPRLAALRFGAAMPHKEAVPVLGSVVQSHDAASEPKFAGVDGDGGAGCDDRDSLPHGSGTEGDVQRVVMSECLRLVENENDVVRRLPDKGAILPLGDNVRAVAGAQSLVGANEMRLGIEVLECTFPPGAAHHRAEDDHLPASGQSGGQPHVRLPGPHVRKIHGSGVSPFLLAVGQGAE